MVCLIVEVHVKASALDEFLDVIEHDAVHSEGDEPGCLRFDVLRDGDDPLTFYFYEVYRDEAALEAHRQMPHFTRWAGFAENGLDREVVLHRATNVHPADAAWR